MAGAGREADHFLGPLQPTRSRLAESRVWSLAPKPSPGSHTLPSAFGKQARSTRASAPSFTFGSGSHDGANLLPVHHSAGWYDPAASVTIGRASAVSTKPTSPRPTMGTSTRSHGALLYSEGWAPRR